jgi:hypothetical protein
VSSHDPLRISVAGLALLGGHGLELRFLLKLRIQNPNDRGLDFDGIALTLSVDGQVVATSVSDVKGSLPRYGEVVIELPVEVSAVAAVHLARILARPAAKDAPVRYELRGKIGAGWLGSINFQHGGNLPEKHGS